MSATKRTAADYRLFPGAKVVEYCPACDFEGRYIYEEGLLVEEFFVECGKCRKKIAEVVEVVHEGTPP